MAPAGQRAVIGEGVKKERIKGLESYKQERRGSDWYEFKQCQ